RKAIGLPVGALRPAVTRARDLRRSEIGPKDWEELRDMGRRVWLFRPPKRHESSDKVSAYMQLETEQGGCHRDAYKVSSRSVWHRVELPLKPDGFLSGMSRNGPWIMLNRFDMLTATNTLYAVRFRQRMNVDAQAAWCLA